MLGSPLPSIKQGYARRKTESDNPDLWQGVEFLLAPLLGLNGGSFVPDYSGFNRKGIFGAARPNPQWVFDGQIKGYVLEWPNQVNSQIDYGDISALRFESAKPWTAVSVFLFGPSFADDQRSFIVKWGAGGNQLIFRKGTVATDPAPIHVFTNGVFRAGTSNVLTSGVYYLAALRNDGTGASGGLDVSVYTVGTQSVLLDADTGQHATDAALTNPIFIGGRSSGGDEMHGRIALTMIATQRWSDAMLAKLARDPYALFRIRDRITRRFVSTFIPYPRYALTGGLQPLAGV